MSPTVGTSNNTLPPADPEDVHFERRTDTLIVPRYAKFEFPSYDGSTTAYDGYIAASKFLSTSAQKEADNMSFATFHLTGEAQLWF